MAERILWHGGYGSFAEGVSAISQEWTGSQMIFESRLTDITGNFGLIRRGSASNALETNGGT